jgi:hypothetical protein
MADHVVNAEPEESILLSLPLELWAGFILPYCSWEMARVSRVWNQIAFQVMFHDTRFKASDINTVLSWAISEDVMRVAKELAKHPETKNQYIMPAIIIAIWLDKLDVLMLLAEHKAAEQHWMSALYYAIGKANCSVVSFLLHMESVVTKLTQVRYQSYLVLTCALSSFGVHYKSTEVLDLLLDCPFIVPNLGVLLRATRMNKASIIRSLLACPRLDPTEDENRALRVALRESYSNVIDELLLDTRIRKSLEIDKPLADEVFGVS